MSRALALCLFAFLAACASNGDRRASSDGSKDGVWGTPNPHEKIGRPYQVNGVWYTPKADPRYDQIGYASWYGPGFHGRLTANGEVFDENRLTAAHPTLPLPSIVEVTNPSNGKRLKLRVNDRGPFANDRILDLSREAARRLGTEKRGVAEVRVRYIGPARLDDAIIRLGEREQGQALYAAVGRPPAMKPYTEEEIPLPELPEETDIILADLHTVTTAQPHLVSTASAEYFVQVGAFSTTSNATSAVALLPEDKPVSLANTERGGTPLTLVRLGPFSHPLAAQEALQEAQLRGFPDAVIVEEVVH